LFHHVDDMESNLFYTQTELKFGSDQKISQMG
jgi:hypothetical protein